MSSPLDPSRAGDDPRPPARGGDEPLTDEPIPTDQAGASPRGGEEIRRELGPGDGDDAPPITGDEPSPR